MNTKCLICQRGETPKTKTQQSFFPANYLWLKVVLIITLVCETLFSAFYPSTGEARAEAVPHTGIIGDLTPTPPSQTREVMGPIFFFGMTPLANPQSLRSKPKTLPQGH